jgi:hypothetical protein
MKTLIPLMTLAFPLMSGSALAADWEKTGDTQGITIYRMEVPGSPVIAFKGEGDIDAPLSRVASVIVDSHRAVEWIDSLVENKILREPSETEYIEYDHIGTPFILKDRDFVTSNKLEFDDAHKQVNVIIKSVVDPLAPETGYVRGELISSGFFLTRSQTPGKTHVRAEIHCDPKGSVPKWIVNLFQKDWPENTIESLRKQVAKPDIVEIPKLSAELAKRGY